MKHSFLPKQTFADTINSLTVESCSNNDTFWQIKVVSRNALAFKNFQNRWIFVGKSIDKTDEIVIPG